MEEFILSYKAYKSRKTEFPFEIYQQFYRDENNEAEYSRIWSKETRSDFLLQTYSSSSCAGPLHFQSRVHKGQPVRD